MGLFERDPVVRLLEELTKRMAAARAGLAGGDPRGALVMIDEMRNTLTGAMASTVARVDGPTVVMLLGREKATAYAGLARLEAEVRSALDDVAGASRAGARATIVERALSG